MTTDDFKREVILALFADSTLVHMVVLKGGNLLDVVYGISTRPSQDIDLSMRGDVDDVEAFRSLIERALFGWFEPKGYTVFDVTIQEKPRNLSDDCRDFWGGYRIEFKVVDTTTFKVKAKDSRKLRTAALAVIGDNGKKFPIDVSKFEYIDESVSELVDGHTVFAYSPQMLVAEKLRAICQQMPKYCENLKKHSNPRGRDFIDIHTVATYFKVDFDSSIFHQTIAKTFQAKRVDVKLLSKIAHEDVREFHRPDFVSIAPTVRPHVDLQDFDFYYDYVVEKCAALKALWSK